MKFKSTFIVALQTILLSRSQWWSAQRVEKFQKDLWQMFLIMLH